MVTRSRFLGSVLLAGALALGPAVSVWAQTDTAETDDTYAPEAPTGDCVQTREDDGEDSTVFAQGDEIQVAGAAGCANPDEDGIEGILESTPVRLFVFGAESDGSYLSPVATIPTDVEPGEHRMIVRTQDNEYVQPITIVAAGGAPTGLPRTGSEIALLVLWGTLSLVLGSVLVGVTWRRWRESRVAAASESAWADEASSLGVLDDRDASSHTFTATEWIDPPRPGEAGDVTDELVDEVPLEETAEVPLEETAELPALDVDEPEEPPEPEETSEVALEAFEAEIAGDEPNGSNGSNGADGSDGAEPNGAEPAETHPNGDGLDAEPTSDPEEIARRASTKTSEIVDRLRDDLAAWKR